jgi:hypothetical protein
MAISALTAAMIGLGTGPAAAGGKDDGEWVPVPEDYWAPIEFEACGDTIRLEGGDVREAEQRVIERDDGTVVTLLRGAATVDLTRLSDGAVIDELDIGGRGREVTTTEGGTTTIVNTLFGSTLLFVTGEPAVDAGFEEAGLPDLGYFADKRDSVTVELTIGSDGALDRFEFTDVDADIVALCPWFDRGAPDDDHDGDRDRGRHHHRHHDRDHDRDRDRDRHHDHDRHDHRHDGNHRHHG